MSRYSGPQSYVGTTPRARVKAQKRKEAEARDAALPQDSPLRRKNRLNDHGVLRGEA